MGKSKSSDDEITRSGKSRNLTSPIVNLEFLALRGWIKFFPAGSQPLASCMLGQCRGRRKSHLLKKMFTSSSVLLQKYIDETNLDDAR